MEREELFKYYSVHFPNQFLYSAASLLSTSLSSPQVLASSWLTLLCYSKLFYSIVRHFLKKFQLLSDEMSYKRQGTALALLLNLSDNCLEQAQFNTGVYQIDKDGPGGIWTQDLSQLSLDSVISMTAAEEEQQPVQIHPVHSISFTCFVPPSRQVKLWEESKDMIRSGIVFLVW